MRRTITRCIGLVSLLAFVVVASGCGGSTAEAKPATQCAVFKVGTTYTVSRLRAGCTTKPKAPKATRAQVTKCKDTPTIYVLPTGWQREGQPFAAGPVPQVETDKCTQGLAAWQLGQDKVAIVNFWRGLNDAWNASRGDGINYEISRNYQYPNGYPNPTIAQADKCMAAGYHESDVLDENSIQPQPGWQDPGAKVVPDGRIYIMTVTTTYNASVAIAGANSAVPAQVHVTVLPDGSVKWFLALTNC